MLYACREEKNRREQKKQKLRLVDMARPPMHEESHFRHLSYRDLSFSSLPSQKFLQAR